MAISKTQYVITYNIYLTNRENTLIIKLIYRFIVYIITNTYTLLIKILKICVFIWYIFKYLLRFFEKLTSFFPNYLHIFIICILATWVTWNIIFILFFNLIFLDFFLFSVIFFIVFYHLSDIFSIAFSYI